MKGIVFSEFIEMLEEQFSPELADEIILSCDLKSGGAYTSVATYDHSELIQLVSKLSEKLNVPVSVLVKTYGKHLLFKFVEGYPSFFDGVKNTFDFLNSIENHVHVEVKKLYHDAELPTFKTNHINVDQFEMFYSSKRPFADLAEGLIEGAAEHFKEQILVERTDIEGQDNFQARFLLTKVKS